MQYPEIVNALMGYGSLLLLIVAVLVFVTTIITEVIKKVIPKVPANILALAVAMICAILAVCITCAVLEITVMWYYAVGAVVLGFFVAYAAMFGFDKFKQTFEKMKSLNT